MDEEVLTGFRPGGLMGGNVSSLRAHTVDHRKATEMTSDQPRKADGLLPHKLNHDKSHGQAGRSLVPHPSVPHEGPSLDDGASLTRDVQEDIAKDSQILDARRPGSRSHEREGAASSRLPKTPLGDCGPQAVSASRLPIFDSDSDTGNSLPQTVRSESTIEKPVRQSSPEKEALEGQCSDASRSRVRSPVCNASDSSNKTIVETVGGAVKAAPVGTGTRVQTPVHGRRRHGESVARTGDQVLSHFW